MPRRHGSSSFIICAHFEWVHASSSCHFSVRKLVLRLQRVLDIYIWYIYQNRTYRIQELYIYQEKPIYIYQGKTQNFPKSWKSIYIIRMFFFKLSLTSIFLSCPRADYFGSSHCKWADVPERFLNKVLRFFEEKQIPTFKLFFSADRIFENLKKSQIFRKNHQKSSKCHLWIQHFFNDFFRFFEKSEIFQIFENSISRKKKEKKSEIFSSKNLKTLFKNLSGTPENSSKRSPQHLGLTSDCCLCSKNICVRLYFVNLLKCSFSFFSNFEGLVLDDHWFDFIFFKK